MEKKKLVIGSIAIVSGIIVAGLGFIPSNAERQDSVEAWNRVSGSEGRETEGTITSSAPETVTEGTRRNRQITTVHCAVYAYTVNGEQYTTKAVGDDCKETADEVALGSTGTIAYDQNDASTAFVKSDATEAYYKNTNGSQWLAWGLGAALVLIGVAVIAGARPKTPEQIAQAEEKRRQTQAELDRLMAEMNEKK